MRINIIPVEYLSDAHLRAEYREILMVPHYILRSYASVKGIQKDKISPTYKLGKGHAMMWYNKIGYIRVRHKMLQDELCDRGFKIRKFNALERLLSTVPKTEPQVTYVPTRKELTVNINRVFKRIVSMFERGKPNFYKLRGEAMTIDDWNALYLKCRDEYKGFTHTLHIRQIRVGQLRGVDFEHKFY
jgi:deoxyribonuclease (pyrimidine dimer)